MNQISHCDNTALPNTLKINTLTSAMICSQGRFIASVLELPNIFIIKQLCFILSEAHALHLYDLMAKTCNLKTVDLNCEIIKWPSCN